jgi:hypothetical protein
MSNSGGLTSNANSRRRRLEAAPLLPHKRPPLDPRAIPGHIMEHPDSDSSSASTRRRRCRRRLKLPSNWEPVAEPPQRTSAHTSAQLLRLPLDPNLVDTESTCPQTLGDKRNHIRLQRANANDARMLSKYLPSHMKNIMPQPPLGPASRLPTPPPTGRLNSGTRAQSTLPLLQHYRSGTLAQRPKNCQR